MNIGSAWLLNTVNGEGGQTRLDTRLSPLGTMAPTGSLTSRPGVIPGSPNGRDTITGLAVEAGGSGMSTRVAPGRAIVQGTAAAGAYPVYVPEYTSITFTDGDAGNPRIDLVVLRVYDDQQDASGNTAAVIEVVPGVPAGLPKAPAAPPASLTLAEVFVKAGASAGTGGIDWKKAVVDRRQATVAAGGIIPADRGLGFDGAYPGQYRDSGTGLQRWDGKQWQDLQPTWQDYTPEWGAESDIQPANGLLTGRFLKVGAQVQFYASLKIGPMSSWGGFAGFTSDWYVTLPVPPRVALPGNFRARTGQGSGAYYFGGCYIYRTSPSDKQFAGLPAGTGVARWWSCNDSDGKPSSKRVGGAYPATPSSNSWYEIWGTYEAAA
ncbi:hypothetical protein [Streptomyces luteireticuli]|uniref:hypothetical protein n=1 Tax=Streptomyces luteireticuli TaxID=173858 RepID=UPI003557D122